MGFSSATQCVIILLVFINLSAANKETCDLYAAVGSSLTLPFVYEGLTNTHVLKWTHNQTTIFYREHGKVSVGKRQDTTATGSLLLKNLHSSSAGIYQVNVSHPNGTLAKTWNKRLCIMGKVSKPQLTYVCDFKSSAVTLNCNVAKPQGLVFSWTLDEKTLSETRQTLSIPLAQLKKERSLICFVANKVSKEKSDTVRPTCTSPSPSPPALLCLTSKTAVAVLAGGAGLILLLLFIIIILCYCQRRNKSQVTLGDKGELRMTSLHKRDALTKHSTIHGL
uniref:Ig-like domain-containing protein n=1 Tax=Mastacembelus armatus TaxID=205130 RepID=A0A3Q3NLP6_9TELE